MMAKLYLEDWSGIQSSQPNDFIDGIDGNLTHAVGTDSTMNKQ